MKLTLVLEVSIDTNGMEVAQAKRYLRIRADELVDRVFEEGMVTGDSQLEVDGYSATIGVTDE